MSISLTKEELQQIRDVSIHNILGVHGNSRRVSMPCPIHSGKNNNFNLYQDNSFHCFKCGAHGNGAIDFVVAMGFSFEDALVELVKYI
jgi:DNA primase